MQPTVENVMQAGLRNILKPPPTHGPKPRNQASLCTKANHNSTSQHDNLTNMAFPKDLDSNGQVDLAESIWLKPRVISVIRLKLDTSPNIFSTQVGFCVKVEFAKSADNIQ